MNKKALAALGVATVLGVLPMGVFAAESSAWENLERGGATVLATIDEVAERYRPMLVAKKAELDKRIIEAQRTETTVTQTQTGALINDATGSELVKPSRPAGTPTDTLKRIGLQLYRGAVLAALFILDHKWILYLILAFLLYKILRALFRRFFTREI